MDDEDDYWNTSETKAKAFSFDDDVLTLQEILAIGQKATLGQEDVGLFSGATLKSALPLSSLISHNVLDLIILAQSGRDPLKDKVESEQTVGVTLKRLTLGRKCSLHLHRSMQSKTELLNGAVAIGDGNVILTVVLFLIQTLNKKLVYELLTSRPLALGHYISFLQNEGKVTELADLLTMLGRSPEAAIYQYQHHVKAQGNAVDGLLRKMTNLVANHFNQPGVDINQCKMVADYIKLLEWQKHMNKSELFNKSPLDCLAYCCRHHWTEGAGNAASPLTLCQRQQISPLQYDWVVLNVHAEAKKWDVVESLFTKKDWLGRTTVSTHIPTETLLSRLSFLGASTQFLALCIRSHGSDRLRLAQQFKIHSEVIDIYAKQKDRAALTNYKMALNPQSEDYILAENTLRDNSIKWKN